MYRALRYLFYTGIFATLTACANLNTISRTTSLGTTGQGKAVHLDIQQRLLIVNSVGKYCAEPSPDALAAYAAAAGLGASSPASGALSAAGSGQSSAASVGLRTQSITLMRDALFRMCEAYANGAVGRAQVSTLLNRSQDLTAVILAVEQLTGAVAANQVALTGTTEANATASLLTSSKQLELAIADENRKQQRLETAMAELAAAKIERDAADKALIAATAKRDKLVAPSSKATEKQMAEAEADVIFRRNELDRNQSAVTATEKKVTVRQTALENAQRTREVIEDKQDAALTTASAATTSAAKFSNPVSRNILDKDATIAIATSVEKMVLAVLQKDYTLDSCMSVITSENIPEDADAKEALKQSKIFCQDIVKEILLVKSIELEQRVDVVQNRINLLKSQAIRVGRNDLDVILGCIAPGGKLDPSKRDQLFDDANSDSRLSNLKLAVGSFSTSKNLREFLAANSNVRTAMAEAAKSSAACTN